MKTYEYNIGGKTGFTEKARRTLVTASLKEDKTCIVVTLNDGNDFADHKNLCEAVFQKYRRVQVLDDNNFKPEENSKYYIKKDFYALLDDSEIDSVRVEYQINKELKLSLIHI